MLIFNEMIGLIKWLIIAVWVLDLTNYLTIRVVTMKELNQKDRLLPISTEWQ
jgi:hypothetical protein